MLEVNSQSNFDDIKKVVSKIGKEVIEFNIIWLNFITRKKIIFLISEILKKYNIDSRRNYTWKLKHLMQEEWPAHSQL